MVSNVTRNFWARKGYSVNASNKIVKSVDYSKNYNEAQQRASSGQGQQVVSIGKGVNAVISPEYQPSSGNKYASYTVISTSKPNSATGSNVQSSPSTNISRTALAFKKYNESQVVPAYPTTSSVSYVTKQPVVTKTSQAFANYNRSQTIPVYPKSTVVSKTITTQQETPIRNAIAKYANPATATYVLLSKQKEVVRNAGEFYNTYKYSYLQPRFVAYKGVELLTPLAVGIGAGAAAPELALGLGIGSSTAEVYGVAIGQGIIFSAGAAVGGKISSYISRHESLTPAQKDIMKSEVSQSALSYSYRYVQKNGGILETFLPEASAWNKKREEGAREYLTMRGINQTEQNKIVSAINAEARANVIPAFGTILSISSSSEMMAQNMLVIGGASRGTTIVKEGLPAAWEMTKRITPALATSGAIEGAEFSLYPQMLRGEKFGGLLGSTETFNVSETKNVSEMKLSFPATMAQPIPSKVRTDSGFMYPVNTETTTTKTYTIKNPGILQEGLLGAAKGALSATAIGLATPVSKISSSKSVRFFGSTVQTFAYITDPSEFLGDVTSEYAVMPSLANIRGSNVYTLGTSKGGGKVAFGIMKQTHIVDKVGAKINAFTNVFTPSNTFTTSTTSTSTNLPVKTYSNLPTTIFTNVPTFTNTLVPTNSISKGVFTNTLTNTNTNTFTNVPVVTNVPVPTSTNIFTSTNTNVNTNTNIFTNTFTNTFVNTNTNTNTNTFTEVTIITPQNFFIPPVIPDMGGGGGSGFSFGSRIRTKKKKRRYTPTIEALVYNIRGKPGSLAMTGIGTRPIR